MDHLSSAIWDIERGCTQCQNIQVNIIQAVKKFIVTHAKITINFFRSGAVRSVFGLSKDFLSFGSSHSIWQNHPSGIQFNVYWVHCLSFHKLQILGGSQIQNSGTFIQHFLAAIKWPNSCRTTNIIKTKIHNITNRHIII